MFDIGHCAPSASAKKTTGPGTKFEGVASDLGVEIRRGGKVTDKERIGLETLAFWQGVVRAGDGDMAAARELYERAAALGETKALVNLGGLEFALNNVETAIELWRRAADAGEVRAVHNLGMAYKHLDRVDEAKVWYEKAVGAGHPHSMFALAEIAHEEGDVETEIVHLEHAAEAGHVDAMVILASRFADRGDYDKAVEWYEAADEAGNLDARYDLALLLGRMGRRDEQKRMLLDLALDDDDDAMAVLATLCLEDGEYESGVRWLTKAAGMNNAIALNNMGVWLRDHGEPEAAKPLFQRAAELGEVNGAVNRSNYAINSGDTREAIFWLKPYWEKNDPLAVEEVEWILDRQKKWAVYDPSALNDLGVLYLDLGEVDEAQKCRREAAERGDTNAMRNMEIVSRQLGRPQEADEWLERVATAEDHEAAPHPRDFGTAAGDDEGVV